MTFARHTKANDRGHAVDGLSLEQVARMLDGEVSGDQVSAPGPGHSPVDRSLSIKLDVNAPAGFLVHSFSGDDPIACKDHVRQKLGLSRWEGKANCSAKTNKVDAIYDYTDEIGALLFQVVRYKPKGFGQRRPDGNGGWIWSLGETRRVLYRLPEVLEAVARGSSIFVAEGEKAVEALISIGLVATCSPCGAGKWREQHSACLHNAHVVLLPDNDEAGEHHCKAVARSLTGIASTVRVLRLPGLAPKEDPYDWVEAGGTSEQLYNLVEGQAVAWPTQAENPRDHALSGAKVLDQVETYIRRFIVYPSDHASVAHTLWIAHTHLMDCWASTPRLSFVSPERGSGKTRALEVMEALVPNPVHAVNVTPAYLFRKVGDVEGGLPTILYDEVDTLFGSKVQDTGEVRGLLNAGHRRGAVTGRCVIIGKKVQTEENLLCRCSRGNWQFARHHRLSFYCDRDAPSGS